MSSEPASTKGAFSPRGFTWLATGNVVFAVTQWGVLVVLAQLGGASEVGELALALAIVTPVFMLARFRLRDVLATDVGGERPLSVYLAVTVINVGLAIPVSVLIASFLTTSQSAVLVVVGMAMARALESISHIFYGLAQSHDDMNPVGQSMIGRGVLGLAFLAVGYAATSEVYWGAAAMALAYAMVLAFHDAPRILARHPASPYHSSRHGRSWRSLLVAGVPLGLFSLLEALFDNIPRLILEATEDGAALGVFAAFGYIVVGGSNITRAIGQAAAPRIAASFLAGDANRLKNQLSRVGAAGALLGVVAVLLAVTIGRPFLAVVLGPEFASHWPAFVLVTGYGAMLFVSWPLTVALIAARRFNQQLLIQLVSVVTVSVVGIFSIDAFGILGAAMSLLAGGAVRLVATVSLLALVIRSLRSDSPGGALTELSP